MYVSVAVEVMVCCLQLWFVLPRLFARGCGCSGTCWGAKVAGGWLQSFLCSQRDLSMDCSGFLGRKAEGVGRGRSTQLCFHSVHFYDPEQSAVGSGLSSTVACSCWSEVAHARKVPQREVWSEQPT